MAMTETNLKYLLTSALLHKDPSHPFRPIDRAVRLGVSRASVSRMLLEFVKEGLLSQKVHSYQLSERGRRMLGEALDHYDTYHAFCTNVRKLSAFDAPECRIALLCNVETRILQHLSQRIRECTNLDRPGYKKCPLVFFSF